MKIQDGTGSGQELRINEHNQASVEAITEEAIHFHSTLGHAYQAFNPSVTLGGTAEHNILYIKNTSESQNFIIGRYLISWNGGSTTYNKPATFKQYINSGEPTANSTAAVAGNLNTTSGNKAAMDVFYWDEVGTAGMTQVAGDQAGEVIVSMGTTQFILKGSLILGPGDTVTISAAGVEIGEVAITLEGHFDN